MITSVNNLFKSYFDYQAQDKYRLARRVSYGLLVIPALFGVLYGITFLIGRVTRTPPQTQATKNTDLVARQQLSSPPPGTAATAPVAAPILTKDSITPRTYLGDLIRRKEAGGSIPPTGSGRTAKISDDVMFLVIEYFDTKSRASFMVTNCKNASLVLFKATREHQSDKKEIEEVIGRLRRRGSVYQREINDIEEIERAAASKAPFSVKDRQKYIHNQFYRLFNETFMSAEPRPIFAELRDSPYVLKALLNSGGLQLRSAPPFIRNDRVIVMAAVTQYGLALKFASADLKNNQAIVMAAVKQYGFALQYASAALRNNPEIVMAAITQHGWALAHASKDLKNNPEIVMAAVKRFGWALGDASADLQNDPAIVMAAVTQDGLALAFASEDLKNDPVIVMAAVKEYGLALKYASEDLQNDPAIRSACRLIVRP